MQLVALNSICLQFRVCGCETRLAWPLVALTSRGQRLAGDNLHGKEYACDKKKKSERERANYFISLDIEHNLLIRLVLYLSQTLRLRDRNLCPSVCVPFLPLVQHPRANLPGRRLLFLLFPPLSLLDHLAISLPGCGPCQLIFDIIATNHKVYTYN